jgi:hypothetical protein
MNSPTNERQPADVNPAEVDYGPLVHRIQSGDQTAVEELSGLFSKGIRLLLQRLQSTDVELELQAVLASVCESLKTDFVESERLPRLVLTTLKHQHRLSRRETSARFGNETWPKFGIYEQHCALESQEEIAETVLQKMSVMEREILRRYYVHGETREAICASQQITAAEVREVIRNAKSAFRSVKAGS